MRVLSFALASLCALAGCECTWKHRSLDNCNPPAECCSDNCERRTRCPKVEVQSAEEIEVRVPRQKVVVEQPVQSAPCQTQPCPPPAAPCLPPPCPPAAPAMPMGYGQPTMAPVTTRVQERTRMGLMFDTVRIPMPIIRPVAIPQPAEMTMTMPMAPVAPTMMPVMPAMMPMVPVQGANMGMLGAQPSLGGQMTIQGQMTMQQAAVLMMAAQGQLSPQAQTLVMTLAASGQLTPQQISTLIESLTPAQTTAPPPRPAGGGSTMSPNIPGANPVAAAGDAPAPHGASAFATEPSAAPSGAAGGQSAAALQEQLRIAEQRLKTLEDNWRSSAR